MATSRVVTSWAVAVAAVAAALVALWPRSEAPTFYFAVTMRAESSGVGRLYYSVPFPSAGTESAALPIKGGNFEADYKFPLLDGRYLNVRFDPINRASTAVTISHARVIDRSGNLVRSIAPERFKILQQIERLQVDGSNVSFLTVAGPDEAALVVDLGPPLILKSYAGPSYRTLLRRFAIALGPALVFALLLLPVLVRKVERPILRLSRHALSWVRVSPTRAIFLTTIAAVTLSCYPIIFFGKSFLSPNNNSHTCLLYGEMPTLPGVEEAGVDNAKGSDLGAAIWYSWPASVIARQAVFQHLEVPLWNRYDSCGLPFLGQGQSMFGDPLNFLVMFSKDSAGWWDFKYILAKGIFVASLGLCVFALTKHVPAAILITGTSAFIGFFSYRYSHPAFFSVCYAPLILLAWFKLIDAPEGRPRLRWFFLMVVANWMMATSGTVKEAYMLLLAMNLCGLLTLLLGAGIVNRATKVCQALVVQGLFVLISTPLWLTFVDTLRSSWTVYDAGAVSQSRPVLLIGLFDDIFYRHLNPETPHVLPSANFFVMIAVLWLCASSSSSDPRKLARGASAVCLLALAFVFGIVPASLILQIPYLGRIYHIDNVFSCVALVCLLLLAGFGIKAFCMDYQNPRCRSTYGRVVVAVAGLLSLYLVFGTRDVAADSFFFWGYSLTLFLGVVASPWLGWRLIGMLRKRYLVCAVILVVLLHWRHGMHLVTPFDTHVINPHQRSNLFADSSATVRLLKDRPAEPFRSVGLRYNFFPGYGSVLGLEQIDGADPLLNKHYKTLIDASGIKLPFASTKEGELGKDEVAGQLPLLDMLNVRYVLGYADGVDEITAGLKKIGSLDLDVYESAKVWPRAFFTDRLITYRPESAFIQLLKEGDGRPFAALPEFEAQEVTELRSLIREGSPASTRQIVPASDYALTTNTTSFKINAPGPGVVVLTEPYIEGEFRLRVNGQPANYFRINSAFRGVFMPAAGDYRISYAYWPRHFTLSLCVSGIGVTSFVFWMATAYRRSRA